MNSGSDSVGQTSPAVFGRSCWAMRRMVQAHTASTPRTNLSSEQYRTPQLEAERLAYPAELQDQMYRAGDRRGTFGNPPEV